MNKKILALLIVLISAISIASVCASENLVSHDFGNFKMNIPDAPNNVAEFQGSVNQKLYNISNTDQSLFATVAYYDSSNTNGNNNTTDFVLNVGFKDVKDKQTNGNVTSFKAPNGVDNVYCISSSDDSKVLVIISGDVRIQDAVNSVEFK